MFEISDLMSPKPKGDSKLEALGFKAWLKHFSEELGVDRLKKLMPLLLQPVDHVWYLPNVIQSCDRALLIDTFNLQKVDGFPFFLPKNFPVDESRWNQVPSYLKEMVYFLDGASAVIADRLPVFKGCKFLDLCAAPGGKSLIVMDKIFLPTMDVTDGEIVDDPISEQRIDRLKFFGLEVPQKKSDVKTPGPVDLLDAAFGGVKDLHHYEEKVACVDVTAGRLVANEISPERQKRLKHVLRSRAPPNAFLEFTSCDITGRTVRAVERLCPYDVILVDAPCSSDRHMLQSMSTSTSWNPGGLKRQQTRQTALLEGAIRLVANGGTIVYSTCALSNAENDEVIEKLFAKYKKHPRYTLSHRQLVEGEVDILQNRVCIRMGDIWCEQLKNGVRFLPDCFPEHSPVKFGPLYMSAFTVNIN